MKKNFFYLCVLFIWSVVGACATSSDKPSAISCMDWLEQLETKRNELLQQPKDQKSWDELIVCTKEISATIGGKYGISSTPATPDEREKIIRSIHRTRQMNPLEQNLTSQYLGYDTTNEPDLSQTSLRKIADRTQTNPEVLQSHFAAIAVVDGASFSSAEVDEFHANMYYDPLDSENIKLSVLLIHNDACKDNFNRMLGPIFHSEGYFPLIQTLKKMVANTPDVPLSTFLQSEAYERIHTYKRVSERLEMRIIDNLLGIPNPTKAVLWRAAVFCERLSKTALAAEVDDRVIAFCQKIMQHPDTTPDDFKVAVKCLKGLDRTDLLENQINRIDATPTNLISMADALIDSHKEDLALKALKQVIGHKDAATIKLEDLFLLAFELERCGEKDLALTTLKQAIYHPAVTIDDLSWAHLNFLTFITDDLAFKVLELAIDHPNFTPSDLFWVADMFQRHGKLELAKKAEEKGRKLESLYKNKAQGDTK